MCKGCKYLSSTARTFGVDGMNYVLNILYFQIFGYLWDNNSLLLPSVLELLSVQECSLAINCPSILHPPSKPALAFFHPSPCQVLIRQQWMEGILAMGMGGSDDCGLALRWGGILFTHLSALPGGASCPGFYWGRDLCVSCFFLPMFKSVVQVTG